MSIRLRLTLVYSTILALTLILFSIVLYAIQWQYTLNILKNDLVMNAQRLTSIIARPYMRSDSPRFPRELPMPLDRPDGGADDQELQNLRMRDMIRLLDAEGNVIEYPIGGPEFLLPLNELDLQKMSAQEPWWEIRSLEGERWLVYHHPIVVENSVIGLLQTARPLADRDRSLQGLSVTLITGSLLTTLIAFGIGWGLSGLTLHPIHRVTQTAQAIGEARDFGQRVQYSGPNDEVGQLATTFNAMLSRLQEAFQRIADALDMQRAFVADVSHELRTPLTTIRGNLALLGREPPIPAEEQADILTDSVGETDRLIRLVNDLLTLAHADAGRKLRRESVEVKPLIEDLCRQTRALDPDRAILHITPPDAAALADLDALRQVLLILLDNALKHTTGNITIKTEIQERFVKISVRDSGPGMDTETLACAFDRFYRGHDQVPGFGLGLSIARTLVEAMDGQIAVESDRETGSVFTVTLPS
ncbi:MAG: HAMP domain-containing histidine kinase [Anaerolineae bacterium]|nr:HAMP domain-containing histidine kinase [Anaerolineae bacterium]